MRKIYNINDLDLTIADDLTLSYLLKDSKGLNTSKILRKLNIDNIEDAIEKCTDILKEKSSKNITCVRYGNNKSVDIYSRYSKDSDCIGFSVYHNFHNPSLEYYFENNSDKLKLLYYLAFNPSFIEYMNLI